VHKGKVGKGKEGGELRNPPPWRVDALAPWWAATAAHVREGRKRGGGNGEERMGLFWRPSGGKEKIARRDVCHFSLTALHLLSSASEEKGRGEKGKKALPLTRPPRLYRKKGEKGGGRTDSTGGPYQTLDESREEVGGAPLILSGWWLEGIFRKKKEKEREREGNAKMARAVSFSQEM